MFRRILAIGALALIQGLAVSSAAADSFGAPAATTGDVPFDGFTCCNLRYEGDWISDANWTMLPVIPAGSRITVKDFGRYRANVSIEGRPMRIGQEYGREQESKEQFIAKLVVKNDPQLRIATFSTDVQAAIRAGKVMPGMTKEQVIISLGYPRTDTTVSLELPEWTYWTHDGDRYIVIWGPNQLVKEIDSLRKIRSLIVYGQ